MKPVWPRFTSSGDFRESITGDAMRCFKSIDDVDCFKSVNEPFWFSFSRLMAAFIMLPWLTPPLVLFCVATSSD